MKLLGLIVFLLFAYLVTVAGLSSLMHKWFGVSEEKAGLWFVILVPLVFGAVYELRKDKR